MTITTRTPATLGCTVLSTALLQAVQHALPDSHIVVYTQFPDLLEGFEGVHTVVDLTVEQGLGSYDIDLENYVELRQPQTNQPRRHLIEHTFEIAEESLGIKLERGFKPILNLTDSEIIWAQEERARLSPDKPFVWLQTKSRKEEKDAPEELWKEILRKGSGRCTFVDLTRKEYSRRQAIALTCVADAGITLDTFLLHGSQAVGAKNVIVILVSSYPEVVCYPDQIIPRYSPDFFLTSDAVLAELESHV